MCRDGPSMFLFSIKFLCSGTSPAGQGQSPVGIIKVNTPQAG